LSFKGYIEIKENKCREKISDDIKENTSSGPVLDLKKKASKHKEGRDTA